MIALDKRPPRPPHSRHRRREPRKPRVLADGRWRGDLLFECGGRDGDRGRERQDEDQAEVERRTSTMVGFSCFAWVRCEDASSLPVLAMMATASAAATAA